MSIPYATYRKLLSENKLGAAKLVRRADIALNTMTRLQKDKEVSLSVLGRLCEVPDCNFGDLVDYVSEKHEEEK